MKVDAMAQARTKVILNQPWFGALALKLRVEALDTLPHIAGTDGVTLFWNPKEFEKLPKEERYGVVAHEVMHCALMHMTRRDSREPQLWNIACDYAINLELKDAGFKLPDGVLMDERFRGMAAEKIYSMLQHEMQQAGTKFAKAVQEALNGQGDFGHVFDAPAVRKAEKEREEAQASGSGQETDSDAPGSAMGPAKGEPVPGEDNPPEEGTGRMKSKEELEQDWQQAVAEASMVAKKAGHLPAGADRVAAAARQSTMDWRDVLRRYLCTIGDYSWMRPNRRHIAGGYYFPGTVKTRLKSLVIAVDTSGSIDQRLLDDFAAECNAIFCSQEPPEQTLIMYCDARVHRVDDVSDEEEIRLRPVGGGGTMFGPVFKRVEDDGVQPDVLIYLTDLESSDKPKDPGYPVLWVVPMFARHTEVPFGFGELVTYDAERR